METISASSINVKDLIDLSQNIAQLNLNYLGICVGILTLLGGVFVYFNIKPLKDALLKQENTIEDLKKEAQALLSKSTEQSREVLERFKIEQFESLKENFKKQEEKIDLGTINKIQKIEKILIEKIESVSKAKDADLKTVILSEVSNEIRILEKTLGDKLFNYEKNTNEELVSLKSKEELNFREVNLKIKELQAFMYHAQGKMGGIMYEIEALEEYVKYKPHLLEHKLKYLSEIIGGYTFRKRYKEDYDKLKDILLKIKGGKYDSIIAEIESKMKFSEEDN